MKTLEGKVAIVTGASRGIGLAIAGRFVTEGATVYITSRNQAELDAVTKELGDRAKGVQADVSKLADVKRLYATVGAAHSRIDIVVANAGFGRFAALGSITEEAIDSTFATNVKGTIFTVQEALPLLSSGSNVILVGSTSSLMATDAFSVYSATKAAIRNLARSWVLDLKGRGIRINVLSPGPTRTPGLVGIVPEGSGDAFLADLGGQSPLGRIGEADEVASAALFLATDASSLVHGSELFVDGGLAQI